VREGEEKGGEEREGREGRGNFVPHFLKQSYTRAIACIILDI
jgi:hypothetical protein